MSLLHADIVVVGSELSGVAAGALLAHAGHRVVVIRHDPDLRAPLGDLAAPVLPELFALPQSRAALALIEKVGLKRDIRRALGEPIGLGLIDDPEARLELFVDDKRRSAELARVFSDDAETFQNALAAVAFDDTDPLFSETGELHDEGFFARRRARKRHVEAGELLSLDRHPDGLRALSSTTLDTVLTSLAPLVCASAAVPPAAISRLLAAACLQFGVPSGTGDTVDARSALRTLFVDVITGHGGECLESGRVSAVEASGKKVTVVKTDERNDYAAKVVIDATRGMTLTACLPEGKPRRHTEEILATVQPSTGLAGIRWLLPRVALPRGLPRRALLLPGAGGEPAMTLAVFDAVEPRGTKGTTRKKRREDQADTEDRMIVVAAAVDDRGDAEWTATAVEQRLDLLMPFAKERAVITDRVVEGTSALFPRYRAAEGASVVGGTRPRTGFHNLVRAGRDLCPALGVEGEIAAAHSVYAAVLDVIGKKKESA